jgi:hypothetical protein
MEWLKETLKRLNWNPVEFMRKTYHVEGATVEDCLKDMGVGAQKHFTKEVQDREQKAGK